ncbi:MAG: DNA polymerase III subunit gamma/tau [Desulfobacterales bacterium]|nr:DNA polymerase III subunit gamma/tau [Desulfobacterales bacterium]
MSYLVLARKYRPQLFEDVVGQSHVTTTLTHAIEAGRVAHAILFSGPRGTGKTTVARILAKAMNCSGRKETGSSAPCNTCRSCTEITRGSSADVFEIDGASNNSVEQVRELRNSVSYMPVYSPFKIYIIDEVHMLSTAAFNALLKTLEEPPPHVMFLFATTEIHKIPITILSRCQRHDMRRVSHADLKAHLETLCRKEEVKVPSESLDLITVEAGGSVRDSLSILDQIIGSASGGSVTHASVLETLGVVEKSDIMVLASALIERKGPELLAGVNRLYTQGSDLKRLFSSLTQLLRNLLVLDVGGPEILDLPEAEMKSLMALGQKSTRGFLTKALELLLAEEPAVRHAAQPKMALELALIKLLQVPDALSIDTLIRKIDTLQKEGGPPCSPQPRPLTPSGVSETQQGYGAPKEEAISKDEPEPSSSDPQPKPEPLGEAPGAPSEPRASAPEAKAPSPSWNPSEPLDVAWGRFLEELRKERPSLAPLLAKSVLKNIAGKSIEIEITASRFNLTRLKNGKKKELEEAIRAWFGPQMIVTLHTTIAGEESHAAAGQASKDQRIIKEAKDHPVIHEAIRVFGGRADVKPLYKEEDHERHG